MKDELIKKETPETVLTDSMLCKLKSMFKNEQSYMYYITTLWNLRELSIKAADPYGDKADSENPIMKIVKLSNDLLGCLLEGDVDFKKDENGAHIPYKTR
jgi:hypothetical protein